MVKLEDKQNMELGDQDLREYMTLIDRFPLLPICSDEQNEAAMEILDSLLDRFDELNAGERAYFQVLSDLNRYFESKWKEELDVTPMELLKFLMEENALSQTDLIPEFGSSSRVSEYFAGRRKLSLNQISKLARRFALSPAAFFKDTEQAEQTLTTK